MPSLVKTFLRWYWAVRELMNSRAPISGLDRPSRADQEPVRRRPGTDAERGPERLTLRARQALQVIQHRRTQLMHRREGELHLGLDSGCPRHPASRRVPGQVIQQRRLARTFLAAQHQHPALTRADRLDQPVENGAFATPPVQLCGASSRPGM